MYQTIRAVALFGAIALIATGCTRDDSVSKQDRSGAAKKAVAASAKNGHDGWWCEEHGVPEEMCSLCMSETDAKTKFKDKGDWCTLHDRAKSQCFKCDPALYAKYEAMYEAKYGNKPPRPPESEFQK